MFDEKACGFKHYFRPDEERNVLVSAVENHDSFIRIVFPKVFEQCLSDFEKSSNKSEFLAMLTYEFNVYFHKSGFFDDSFLFFIVLLLNLLKGKAAKFLIAGEKCPLEFDILGGEKYKQNWFPDCYNNTVKSFKSPGFDNYPIYCGFGISEISAALATEGFRFVAKRESLR